MIFVRIDQWILEEGFQRFTDWFQKLTGKDCFWVATFLVQACMCFQVSAPFLLGNGEKTEEIMLALFGGIGFTLLCLTPMLFIVSERRRIAFQAVQRGLQNPLKLNSGVRLFISAVNTITVTYGIMTALSAKSFSVMLSGIDLAVIFTVYGPVIYLSSCTPLPPAPSKLGEWAKSLWGRTKEAIPVPAPQPIPIQ